MDLDELVEYVKYTEEYHKLEEELKEVLVVNYDIGRTLLFPISLSSTYDIWNIIKEKEEREGIIDIKEHIEDYKLKKAVDYVVMLYNNKEGLKELLRCMKDNFKEEFLYTLGIVSSEASVDVAEGLIKILNKRKEEFKRLLDIVTPEVEGRLISSIGEAFKVLVGKHEGVEEEVYNKHLENFDKYLKILYERLEELEPEKRNWYSQSRVIEDTELLLSPNLRYYKKIQELTKNLRGKSKDYKSNKKE